MSSADNRSADVISTWGRCLADELRDVVPICGEEAYSIFDEAFEADLTIAFLQSMTEADFDTLLNTARTFLENPAIGMAPFRQAVEATIWNWTDDGGEEDNKS